MITNHLLNGMILPVGRYVSSLPDEGYTRIPPPIQDARSNYISYSIAGSKIDSFASYVNCFFSECIIERNVPEVRMVDWPLLVKKNYYNPYKWPLINV